MKLLSVMKNWKFLERILRTLVLKNLNKKFKLIMKNVSDLELFSKTS